MSASHEQKKNMLKMYSIHSSYASLAKECFVLWYRSPLGYIMYMCYGIEAGLDFDYSHLDNVFRLSTVEQNDE